MKKTEAPVIKTRARKTAIPNSSSGFWKKMKLARTAIKKTATLAMAQKKSSRDIIKRKSALKKRVVKKSKYSET